MRVPLRLSLLLSCFIAAVGCGGDDDGSDRADAAGGADAAGAPDGGAPDAGAQAWLDGWSYRRPLVISAPPSTPPTENQQLYFDLYVQRAKSDGKMRGDLGDIRVTGPDGTTVLPYWIEGIPTFGLLAAETPTRIWFKSPEVLPDAQWAYVYYGNPDATSMESGTDTFEFFDDFDGAALDPMWTVATLDQGVVSVADGQLRLTAAVGSTGSAASITGPPLFTSIVIGTRVHAVVAPPRSHADLLLRSTDVGWFWGSGTWVQVARGIGAPTDGPKAWGTISSTDGFGGTVGEAVDAPLPIGAMYLSAFGSYFLDVTWNRQVIDRLNSEPDGWAVSSAVRPGFNANTYGAGAPAFDYRFDWIFAAKRPAVSLTVVVAPEEEP